MTYKIRKGDPVEFTRHPVQNYTMRSGIIGIAIEDERSNGSVVVELADGSTCLAIHIHAYAWGGWLPEELEETYRKYQPFQFDEYDCY